MKLIQHQADFDAALNKEPLWLLFTSSATCGVCQADWPRVQQIAAAAQVPLYQLKVEQVPWLVGQLHLFAVQALLIYLQGREVHRQVSIIDFETVNFRLNQYIQALK